MGQELMKKYNTKTNMKCPVECLVAAGSPPISGNKLVSHISPVLL